MSNVLIDRDKIDILANAISDKSGVPVTMTLDEMVEAVDGIETNPAPTLQAKTYTVDSAGTATVTADSGYDGLSEVEVSVPSAVSVDNGYDYEFINNNGRKWRVRTWEDYDDGGYISGVQNSHWQQFAAVASGTSVTPTTSTQTIGGANYMMEGAVTVAAMPSGTEGTPTATKGSVSNHSISVTPSVTNTTGWITGSTKTGTAVTVSASELASGNKAITENGSGIDVVGYSTVSVNVPNNDIWKPIQAQTRTIIEDPDGNYLWYDNTAPAFAEGQTWRVTWGNETYIVQTKYVEINNVGYWVIGNPGAIGYTDDGTGYSWIAWNQNSSAIAIGTSETGSKKVILELQQSNPYQAKTVTYTPSETQQTATVVPDSGYNGLSTVGITVNAISSTYVGSGITRRSSTDLTASGATITAPAGYYSTAASKSVATGTTTAPTSISGTSATVSTGTNTLTLTKTVSVTPRVTTAGYVSAGTAGNSSVSLTASVTTKAAATITPTTTDQTIAAGTYLTGAQTIAGDADLVASNIVSGVQIFGVTGNVVLQNYYTGSSAPSSSLGSNGDLYLQT